MEMNHVLIVEDDKEIREGVKIYLKSKGYVVSEAADGIEGLEIIEKEEIHLATPLFLAASATALATVPPTLSSKAAGMI